MALVRSRDTRPEIRVRKALHAAGLRYRLHDRDLPGIPDLVFRSRHIVVFVHGCFWHRHRGCSAARLPKSNQEFWTTKLTGNVERDKRTKAELELRGWIVLIIWECETKAVDALAQLAKKISDAPVVV